MSYLKNIQLAVGPILPHREQEVNTCASEILSHSYNICMSSCSYAMLRRAMLGQVVQVGLGTWLHSLIGSI